jgi:hypothetical protein
MPIDTLTEFERGVIEAIRWVGTAIIIAKILEIWIP